MNKSESKYFNTALLMDEALLLLLENKEFDFITVKEVCQKAGVNRSTFYLHYENTSDLLVEAINVINQRFAETFKDIKFNPKENPFFITKEYLIPYLNFVKENKRVFKLIHEKPELFNSKTLSDRLYKEMFSPILDKFNVKENEKQYVFTFYTQGVLSIVLRWLGNDCKDEIETISNIIINLIGDHN